MFVEIKPNTILWLIVTGTIGGFIGSSVKFLFDQILGPKLKKKRKAENTLKQYTFPLLRSLDSFDKRLENLIKFLDKDWFNNKNDDYYKLSTLYIFGNYFGWAKIIENEAFLEFEKRKKEKRFYMGFYRIFKSLTGSDYFENTQLKDSLNIDSSGINRFVLTAIGELMIKRTSGCTEVIGFVEFTKKYAEDGIYKKWFSYVEKFISTLSKSESNIDWNRIVILSISVRSLICLLDPKNKLTAKRQIINLELLHPELRSFMQKEIQNIGLKSMIKK